MLPEDTLFTLDRSQKHDPAVDEWLSGEPAELLAIARRWFSVMRNCGDDVTEILHDGCPTACIGNAAFAYVNVFKAHVNIGFFSGAALEDPNGLLEGSGKRMRHVKVRIKEVVDEVALEELIVRGYLDVRKKL